MNKTKLIILPLLVAPVLFGCNKEITGNYVVNRSITYIFSEGTEEDYSKETDQEVYLPIRNIKQKIYDILISYMDGTYTEDNAIHLTNEFLMQRKTKSGESIETRACNVKEEGESGSIGFEWGKDKIGYHFYDNYTGYVDNLRVYEVTHNTKHVWIGDNGFTINGNTLTAHFAAEFNSNEGKELDYKIDFTVTAKK